MIRHPASTGLVVVLLLFLTLGAAGPASGDSDESNGTPPPPVPDSKAAVPKVEEKSAWQIPAWLTRQRDRPYVRKGTPRSERKVAVISAPDYADAIAPALAWLEKNQHESGRWSSEMEGKKGHDVGVTGLAVLAFLTNGETIRSGPHDKTVMQGVKWLMTTQNGDGIFAQDFKQGTPSDVYGHAIATLALAEAYGMTGSVYLKTAAQRGVDAIQRMQNPYLGWRYGIRTQDNDTSVTTMMVHALYSAKAAGLKVGQEGFDGARAWMEKMTEPEYGRVGYTARGTAPSRPEALIDRFPADRTESLTAMGVFTRILTGEDPRKSEVIVKGLDLIEKVPMEWDHAAGTIDMIYWHYATLAVFQAGGDPWKKWQKALKTEIADHQITEGERKGSWNPIGVWGKEGGRVFSTAIMTLTLETYRRYPARSKGWSPSGRKKNRRLR